MNWLQWGMGIVAALMIAVISAGLRLWRDVDVEKERVGVIGKAWETESRRNDTQDTRLAQQDNTLARIDENVKFIRETIARLEKQD